MNKIFITIILLLFLPKQENDKDFHNYHLKFIEIEDLISNENFRDAETELELLLEEYNPSFTKDYVILAQLFLINNKKSESIRLLKQSMEFGAKLECLREIDLLNKNIPEDDWQKIESQAEQLTAIYHSKINLSLGIHFNRNYQKEQDNKSKRNYKSVVYSNFSKIKTLTDKGTFPGEYLIGIDNKEYAPKISECSFGNSKIIVTLLHFDYSSTSLTEDKLVTAIRKGQLHPREFASFYTFEQNRHGQLYKKSDKNRQTSSNYNFLFPFEQRSGDIEKVNADRKKFGICSKETDLKKILIEEKYGMKLKFGYK